MKKNMFKTDRHQLDQIMDYRDGIYQPEDFHDDAFQILDTFQSHEDKKEDKDKKKKVSEPKTHKGHKTESAPMACSPDEKVEDFNKQARHGAGRKGTKKTEK